MDILGAEMEPEMKNIMFFVCEYHNKQVTRQNKVCPSYNFEGLDSYIWHSFCETTWIKMLDLAVRVYCPYLAIVNVLEDSSNISNSNPKRHSKNWRGHSYPNFTFYGWNKGSMLHKLLLIESF